MADAAPLAAGRRSVSLSIVIPVRNEGDHIGRILTSLLAQNFPAEQFEILVVDGCSTDTTVRVVQEFVNAHGTTAIRLLHNPRRYSSSARNIGIANSSFDHIVIIDGHCEIASPDLLAATALLIATTGARTLGRPQPFWSPNATPFEAAVMLARSSPLGHAQDSLIHSGAQGWVSPLSVAVIYHKSLFEQFGLFDERFDAAEDVEFNRRLAAAGIRCFISPALTVSYRPRSSMRGLLWQMWRYGNGRGRFYRKHPQALTLSAAAPSLAVLGATVLMALAANHTRWRAVLACACATYVLLVTSSFHGRFRDTRSKVLLGAIGLVSLIHLTLGVGMLSGALRPLARAAPLGEPLAPTVRADEALARELG